MSFKKFTYYLVFTLTIFASFNFAIWQLYTKKILTREDNLATGDLARMGYISGLTHERENIINLPIEHFFTPDTTIKYDLMTIGDSFSQGIGWGLNRYYQDYIASAFNWNVLNLIQHPNTKNYIEAIILLSNSGFFEKYQTKYILIETVQRQVVSKLSRIEDYEIQIEPSKIEAIYKNKQNKDFTLPSIAPINNGNFKFLINSLLYNFSERAFFSEVHKTLLNTKLFSIGSGQELLYYHADITSIKNNTEASIQEVNNHLNHLSTFLKRKGIQLIFMPVVNKYDLYSEFIIKNKYPKDPFFDILRELKKDYIFIDTKEILFEELKKGKKDIFYCDDTHWSYKASEAITHNLGIKLIQ